MTKKQKNMLTRILVTAVLYAALVAADHMKMIPAVFEGWKLLFLYLIPYFVIGWDILYKAVRNIKNGQIFDPEKESDVTAALEKFLELDKESIQKKLALK